MNSYAQLLLVLCSKQILSIRQKNGENISMCNKCLNKETELQLANIWINSVVKDAYK